jgi:hypothetical protein
MAMAIPMTTLEDRLQDEAWMNANKILIGFLYTVMSNKQLISAFISKKKKKKRMHLNTVH